MLARHVSSNNGVIPFGKFFDLVGGPGGRQAGERCRYIPFCEVLHQAAVFLYHCNRSLYDELNRAGPVGAEYTGTHGQIIHVLPV